MKDNDGILTGKSYSLAHRESRDGFDWRPAKHVFVTTPEIAWTDGTRKKLNALERPQLVFEARGTPVTLLCAGADTADRTRSFNVASPLRAPPDAAFQGRDLLPSYLGQSTSRLSDVERGPGSRARVGFDR